MSVVPSGVASPADRNDRGLLAGLFAVSIALASRRPSPSAG
jgi:hypothetical protein